MTSLLDSRTVTTPLARRTAAPVLRRPVDDRVLTGVASGLGRHLGVDPLLVRIVFVLLAAWGGSGLLLYAVGVLAVPSARPGDRLRPAVRAQASRALVAVTAVLVAVATLSVLDQLMPVLDRVVGPLLLLGAGVVVMLAGRR